MLPALGLLLALFAIVAPSRESGAAAEKRIALVIGNGAYKDIGTLPNPPADAELIAATLQALGFETTLLKDSDQNAMKKSIADFGRALRAAGRDAVGLFYFAGHGVQASGNNYLIPIDANLTDVADLDLSAVEANWVLRQMESAGNVTNIIVLDACRNNPFATSTRAVDRGLARIDAPTGSFLAYATAPGQVAADGDGTHSPYTMALVEAMQVPGIPIEQLFKQVRIDVIGATAGKQTPWDSSSLIQDFFFNSATPKPTESNPAEMVLWESISRSGDRELLELFLKAYPQSVHAAEAGELLAAIPKNGQGANANAAVAGITPGALAKTPPGNLSLFDTPLAGGSPNIIGRSFRELIQGSAEFSPVEGLEESAWQGKPCSSCHQWTRELLCEQGLTYKATGEEQLAEKAHPYGLAFKQELMKWAAGGCL